MPGEEAMPDSQLEENGAALLDELIVAGVTRRDLQRFTPEKMAACLAGLGDIKPRPNHQRELEILRSLTPAQKLEQVFKLNERTLQLMRAGLRRRFPDLNDQQLHEVYLRWRERCRNQDS